MKRALALGVLVAFLVLTGCSSILGPPSVDQGALNRNASYDWQTDVNASITVTGGEYEAVYNVTNRSEFVVNTRDELGRERPLSVSALKFRYPDGTVANASAMKVTNERERTVIELPARNGTLAFTAPADTKRFATQTFVEGTYEVTLPAGMRVEYVPLARVSPPGYSTERTADDRVRIHWDDVESRSVAVRYYLARDLYIFAAGAVVLVLVALVGALYYLRQIRDLERRREDVGLDVETDDDGP